MVDDLIDDEENMKYQRHMPLFEDIKHLQFNQSLSNIYNDLGITFDDEQQDDVNLSFNNLIPFDKYRVNKEALDMFRSTGIDETLKELSLEERQAFLNKAGLPINLLGDNQEDYSNLISHQFSEVYNEDTHQMEMIPKKWDYDYQVSDNHKNTDNPLFDNKYNDIQFDVNKEAQDNYSRQYFAKNLKEFTGYSISEARQFLNKEFVSTGQDDLINEIHFKNQRKQFDLSRYLETLQIHNINAKMYDEFDDSLGVDKRE